MCGHHQALRKFQAGWQVGWVEKRALLGVSLHTAVRLLPAAMSCRMDVCLANLKLLTLCWFACPVCLHACV